MTGMPAAAPVAPAGEFRVGEVFSRAWTVLSGNVAKFLPLTAILALPNLVGLIPGISDGTAIRNAPPNITPGAIFAIAGSVIVWIILNVVTEATVLYGSFQAMRNRPVEIGESFKKGLARLVPIIGLSICAGVTIVLGLMLFLVPGLILLSMFFVALPACVVEGLGPFQSMGRSSALTKGHRWKIFGIWLLLVVVGSVVGGIVTAVLSVVGLVLPVIGQMVWNTLMGAYQSIVVAVAYHDLRVAKEGVDIDHIAAVFD
jgi:hypothetical protein